MIGRDAIVAEAGRNMMDTLYQQALDEQELQPISEPMVDIYNEEPVAFKVVVEVFPSVELGDYKSVRVDTREVDIDDEDVDSEIEALLKNQAEWVDVDEDRQPDDGDQVTIDLEVYDGDDHFQDPAQDAVFILGESNLFESIVEALKLMTPGTSSELTLAFEDDDESVRPTMRGKTLRYAITLKQIRSRDMPELDDEFAATVGEFESVDELREAVAEDVLRRKAREQRSEVFNEIVSEIVELSEVQVPDTLVTSELEDQISQLRTRLAQQGVEFQDYLTMNGQSEDELREDLRDTAEERVRNTLVLQEVSKAEGLEVTEEDFAAEIDNLVAGRPNPEQLRSLYESDYFRGMLENELHDRKMMEMIVSLGTEGRGAISGPGADLLAADEAPPEPDDESDGDEEESTQTATAETDDQVTTSEDDTSESDSDPEDDASSDDGEESEDDEEDDDASESDEDENDESSR